jgi:hypothetical protein
LSRKVKLFAMKGGECGYAPFNKFNKNDVDRILLDSISSGIKAAGLKPDARDPGSSWEEYFS